MKKAVLVVVDMQNDFVTGVLGTKEAAGIVDGIKKACEDFDGDIIFTMDTHYENYMETQEGKNLPVIHCVRETEGWEIVPELKAIADTRATAVIEKPTFGSKLLGELISDKGYEEVILCGVCTGICVLSNAIMIKGFAPEVPIKVLRNLCACVTPQSHETALAAMKTCQIEVI